MRILRLFLLKKIVIHKKIGIFRGGKNEKVDKLSTEKRRFLTFYPRKTLKKEKLKRKLIKVIHKT